MAKIIITADGTFIKEVELVKERMTIGRKPHNDIVIDHRAVSSAHATITVLLDEAILEDLDSTNGTFIEGERVTRRQLASGDKITIAVFELQYLATPPKAAPTGKVEVMNGAHKGKQLPLNKPLTTVGKPGVSVVAITYAGGSYSAAKIEGEQGPTINGAELEDEPRRLEQGDVLDLSGTRMVFLAK